MNLLFNRYKTYLAIMITALVVGVAIGVYLPVQSPIDSTGGAMYEHPSSYKFINPLLTCGDDKFSHIQNGQVRNLQDEINSYIKTQQNNNSIDTASVYFRELNGGQFFSINSDLQFVPASLLKVPLAMSVYQQAELNPSILAQKVFYQGAFAPASEHFTAPTLTGSTTYAVSDLLDAMITNSDKQRRTLAHRCY